MMVNRALVLLFPVFGIPTVRCVLIRCIQTGITNILAFVNLSLFAQIS